MSTEERVIALLRGRGWTLATAESLTAGRIAAAVADVPGCSDVLRGGVVAYQADVKAGVLGVPSEAVEAGVVSRAVVEAMAAGARRVLQADVAVACTGVAGPDAHAGEPVGSVWIAVATPASSATEHLSLSGDRDAIRYATTQAVLSLLLRVLEAGE